MLVCTLWDANSANNSSLITLRPGQTQSKWRPDHGRASECCCFLAQDWARLFGLVAIRFLSLSLSPTSRLAGWLAGRPAGGSLMIDERANGGGHHLRLSSRESEMGQFVLVRARHELAVPRLKATLHLKRPQVRWAGNKSANWPRGRGQAGRAQSLSAIRWPGPSSAPIAQCPQLWGAANDVSLAGRGRP